jgi:hypothetical protein
MGKRATHLSLRDRMAEEYVGYEDEAERLCFYSWKYDMTPEGMRRPHCPFRIIGFLPHLLGSRNLPHSQRPSLSAMTIYNNQTALRKTNDCSI